MKTFLILSSLLISSFSVTAQGNAKPAKEILDTAYRQAAEQHKNVTCVFLAPTDTPSN